MLILGAFQNCSSGGGGSGGDANASSSGGSGAWTCYAEGSSSMNADGTSPSPISVAWSNDDYETAGSEVIDKCSGIMSLQMGTEGNGIIVEACHVTHCTHP